MEDDVDRALVRLEEQLHQEAGEFPDAANLDEQNLDPEDVPPQYQGQQAIDNLPPHPLPQEHAEDTERGPQERHLYPHDPGPDLLRQHQLNQDQDQGIGEDMGEGGVVMGPRSGISERTGGRRRSARLRAQAE